MVANRDLAARTTVRAEDLTTVGYSPADVPPGVLAKPGDAVGQVVEVQIKKGQPLFTNQLGRTAEVTAGPQGAYLPLPTGYVALTVPTGEIQGVAGYIQAGDYIDIVAIIAPKGSGPNVRTIYSNIHVLRVGPAPDSAAGAQRTGGLSSSLTFEVTQCQAEFLNWFLANTTLKYTLLSSKDYKPNAAPDASCPPAGAVKGVTDADVRARWPGLI